MVKPQWLSSGILWSMGYVFISTLSQSKHRSEVSVKLHEFSSHQASARRMTVYSSDPVKSRKSRWLAFSKMNVGNLVVFGFNLACTESRIRHGRCSAKRIAYSTTFSSNKQRLPLFGYAAKKCADFLCFNEPIAFRSTQSK
jgi:hypothetical protein